MVYDVNMMPKVTRSTHRLPSLSQIHSQRGRTKARSVMDANNKKNKKKNEGFLPTAPPLFNCLVGQGGGRGAAAEVEIRLGRI